MGAKLIMNNFSHIIPDKGYFLPCFQRIENIVSKSKIIQVESVISREFSNQQSAKPTRYKHYSQTVFFHFWTKQRRRGSKVCKVSFVQQAVQTPNLTILIEALENFQQFEPTVKARAIALYASELGIPQLHLYAITLQAGLEVS
jgi:hypothetical protein